MILKSPYNYEKIFGFVLTDTQVYIFAVQLSKRTIELLTLEIIHRYVELLDKYFGNVSIVI